MASTAVKSSKKVDGSPVADRIRRSLPSTADDEARLSLSAVLRRQLSRVDPDNNVTWGELVVEELIAEALGGNFRALEAILDRVDGAGASHGSSTMSTAPSPEIDDRTACKILEVLCDPDDTPPSG